MKNKLILMLLTFCVFSSLYGYDIKVDGLYYNLYSKISEAELTTGEDKYTGDIAIPETITVDGKTYTVTSIKEGTFSYNYSVHTVSIPNTVRKIGSYTFSNTYLQSIQLPNSLQVIEHGLFDNCKYLESINIPENVTCIEGEAFRYCQKLYIPIVIPESVDSIGEFPFAHSAISSVTLPNHKVKFGECTFAECDYLESFTFPDWMTSIPRGFLEGCSKLKSITIPISITAIGEEAFFRTGISSINIPNTVSSIGRFAFTECSHLSNLTLSNSITTIRGETFRGCTSLTSVIIPNSVKTIEPAAFLDCTGLKDLYLSSELEEIKYRAFEKCCNLENVYCYSKDVPTIDETTFLESQIEYSTLYVPQESIDLYRQAKSWSDFGTICSLEGEGGEIKPEEKPCAKPTISFLNGEIIFDCETEGVDFISEISDPDVKRHYESRIPLGVTYTISVYATKAGYTNSEVATKEIQLSINNIEGDLNKDGKITVADVSELVNRIMEKTE